MPAGCVTIDTATSPPVSSAPARCSKSAPIHQVAGPELLRRARGARPWAGRSEGADTDWDMMLTLFAVMAIG